MRNMIVAASAIVAATAAALAAVWMLTRGDAPASAESPPGAQPETSPALAAPASPFPAAPAPPPPPLVEMTSQPRAEPQKGTWEAVPVVARASQLGPLGGAVGRGLIELQPRLAACFDEDTAARFGPQPHTVAKDASISDAEATVLVLHLETDGGEARIVDAPVESQGAASDGVVACAQSVLRGQRFSSPQAPAGGRYRLLHPLQR